MRQIRRKLLVMRSAHVQTCRVGINRPTACRLAVNVSRRAARDTFGQMCPGVRVQCCFTCTETVRLMKDVKPRTATSTFTQLLSSECVRDSRVLYSFLPIPQYCSYQPVRSDWEFLSEMHCPCRTKTNLTSSTCYSHSQEYVGGPWHLKNKNREGGTSIGLEMAKGMTVFGLFINVLPNVSESGSRWSYEEAN